MNDEEIMLQVSNGELAKATFLFERYNLTIYNYFVRNTMNKMISQDLTQNVFQRMIKYRQSYREEYTFKPWIFRIARNVLMDHVKEEKKHRGEEIHEELTGNLFEENFLDKTERIEKEKTLQKALLKLKADEREVLILSKYQEMKYSEIAQVMNVTESAIKVKVHRAIKNLRESYFQLEKV